MDLAEAQLRLDAWALIIPEPLCGFVERFQHMQGLAVGDLNTDWTGSVLLDCNGWHLIVSRAGLRTFVPDSQSFARCEEVADEIRRIEAAEKQAKAAKAEEECVA